MSAADVPARTLMKTELSVVATVIAGVAGICCKASRDSSSLSESRLWISRSRARMTHATNAHCAANRETTIRSVGVCVSAARLPSPHYRSASAAGARDSGRPMSKRRGRLGERLGFDQFFAPPDSS
jgi:hypothetical protein